MAIYNNVTELIGKTPILNLNNFAKEQGAQANILAKLEYFNPAGSVKDRIANAMISAAEADGTLKHGATIIEPTSGTTGIGLATLARQRAKRLSLQCPKTMSVCAEILLRHTAQRLFSTEGAKGMKAQSQRLRSLRKAPRAQ
jgi:cysteine synthase A